MAVESNKHSPKVDDALKNPRVVEPRGYKHEAEPLDDDAFARPRRAGGPPGTPPGIGPDEIDLRSELAQFVDRSVFPADRGALLASARDHDAPSRVIAELRALPDENTYPTVQAVWQALGGHTEQRD